MSIELPCGGNADPLTVSFNARHFRCSKGCKHAVTEDHRALLAEFAERSHANEIHQAKRTSNYRKKTVLAWGGGIGSLWGINALLKASAADPSAWEAGFVGPAGPVVRTVLIGGFIIVLLSVIFYQLHHRFDLD